MIRAIRTAPRLHPLVAAAAASVIVVSAAGVAALTGLLPTSKASAVATAQLAAPAAVSPAPVALPTPMAAPDVAAAPAPIATRQIWRDGRQIAAAVYARKDIGASATIRGPAIVEQLDTTTFILPGWQARADRFGALHVSRERVE